MKNILVFAHRAEAKFFLESENFTSLQNLPFSDVYASEKSVLLISGEGIQATTEKLSIVLTVFSGKISEVLNFGVAGSLTEKLTKNEVYKIRTVYNEKSKNEVNFKSFTSEDKTASVDCITTFERVFDKERAKFLSCFAEITDRELWAIASVCNLFKVPFKSCKLISDFADGEISCFEISENAFEFSQKLFENYTFSGKKPIESEFLAEGFYFSTAQKNILYNFQKALAIKLKVHENEVLNFVDLQEILQSETRPKQRTSLLFERLNELLNPFNAKLKSRLDELAEPLKKANCEVKFAKDYENDSVTLSVKIEHKKHVEKLKNALEKFDYEAIREVLNGEKSKDLES